MTEQLRPGFERWAAAQSLDTDYHLGRYSRPVTRWAFAAWCAQAERITALAAQNQRLTAQVQSLQNDCHRIDTARATHLQHTTALGEEVESLRLQMQELARQAVAAGEERDALRVKLAEAETLRAEWKAAAMAVIREPYRD